MGPNIQVELLTKDLDEPNGLAFSPQGTKFYVDDSKQRNIRVYDFRDGKLSNGRIFGVEPGGPKEGVPDGMKVDRQGNLYVVGPRGIWVWDSSWSSSRNHRRARAARQPCLGRPGLSTLYITATTSVYKISTRAHGFIPYL